MRIKQKQTKKQNKQRQTKDKQTVYKEDKRAYMRGTDRQADRKKWRDRRRRRIKV